MLSFTYLFFKQRANNDVINTTFDKLRQCLITVWCELKQRIVDDAIDQWRRRLLACVDAEGGHFDHSL